MNTTVLKVRSLICSICFISYIVYKRYSKSDVMNNDGEEKRFDKDDVIQQQQQQSEIFSVNIDSGENRFDKNDVIQQKHQGEIFSITSDIESKTVVKYFPHINGTRLKYKDAMMYLVNNEHFRFLLTKTLQDSKFDAYFFETPSVCAGNYTDREFEFVLVNADTLSKVEANPYAFKEHFNKCKHSNAVFHNIGKDAVLISPCPNTQDNTIYTHLAIFLRNAEIDQINEFWKFVGEEMNKRVPSQNKKPTWLSTSGLGIYWLHMRLDSRPKYYTYNEYRKF